MRGLRLAMSGAVAVICYCVVGIWQRFASSGSEFAGQVRLYASLSAACCAYIALVRLARSRPGTMSARQIFSVGAAYGFLAFLVCSFAVAAILFAFDSGSCGRDSLVQCLWSSTAFGIAAPLVLAWRSFGLLPLAAVGVAISMIAVLRTADRG